MPTALSPALTNMYLDTRPGIGPKPTTVYDGLVSELAAGDWLPGSRQRVVAVGATSNGLRSLTLARSNAANVTVLWVATSGLRFAR